MIKMTSLSLYSWIIKKNGKKRPVVAYVRTQGSTYAGPCGAIAPRLPFVGGFYESIRIFTKKVTND